MCSAAPLNFLKNDLEYYASEDCLSFGVFVFYNLLQREEWASATAMMLSVFRMYISSCSREAVLRSAGIQLASAVLPAQQHQGGPERLRSQLKNG